MIEGGLGRWWSSGRSGRVGGSERLIGSVRIGFDPEVVGELAEDVVVVEVGGDFDDDFGWQGVHALLGDGCLGVV